MSVSGFQGNATTELSGSAIRLLTRIACTPPAIVDDDCLTGLFIPIFLTLAPTKNSYLNYGFYDGHVARGVQTGLTGPHFNGRATTYQARL
jgi:prepilin-type processing-associated H-X9-DG protein